MKGMAKPSHEKKEEEADPRWRDFEDVQLKALKIVQSTTEQRKYM